jgi:hypothetical protein
VPRKSRILIVECACVLMAALVVWAAGASPSFAQLRGLKVPSIPQGITKPGKPGSPEVKPSRPGSPEVQVLSMISPDSAPPGGHGQLVLTGRNFKDGTPLTFDCTVKEPGSVLTVSRLKTPPRPWLKSRFR